MSKLRHLAVLAAIALIATLVPAAGASGAAKPKYREYVALGDSWSADVVFFDLNGLPSTRDVPLGCAQSNTNYPKLVAQALKVPKFRDATCGSATTKDFYQPQSVPIGQPNPPQFDRLTRNTDLVTVGIGGNDAGFAGAAIGCLNALPVNVPELDALPNLPVAIPFLGSDLPLGGCKHRWVKDGRDILFERIKASEGKLVKAVNQIRKRSPKARVLLVNYLDAIPDTACYPLVPISQEDISYLRVTFGRLNAMVARAAKRSGAELVNTFGDSRGHHVCSGPTHRYVEGLGVVSLNGVAIAVPAHPNSAGAASQYRSVMKVLQRKPPRR